jgi:diadenosine tetraphosphate (Ap4A) HIT family hydrolase
MHAHIHSIPRRRRQLGRRLDGLSPELDCRYDAGCDRQSAVLRLLVLPEFRTSSGESAGIITLQVIAPRLDTTMARLMKGL